MIRLPPRSTLVPYATLFRSEVQLALVGSMATDDPEGWEFFNSTMAYADGDPDIHILNNLNSVGAIEVNAFQSQADRSEEHTSELQSRQYLVCRLLLEKKKHL